MGRYSDVYEGVNVESGDKVAVKILRPIKKEKTYREIKVMMTLADCPNIAHFIDIVKDSSTKTTSLVTTQRPL